MIKLNFAGLLSFSDPLSTYIFWDLRLPRTLTAYLVGASLAVGGVVFQALFRNVLAAPFTLGVSSGAALGASLALKFGLAGALLGLPSSMLWAFTGALATIVLVYFLGGGGRPGEQISLLLAGVVLSFFFSSLTLFVQYLSDFTELYQITHWLMGRLDMVGYSSLLLLLPFVAVGCLGALWLAPELDLMTLGDELALTRGVALRRVRLTLYLTVSLMVAAVVSLCGVIGFIGVVVPYLCRALIGPTHRRLIPAAFLGGGVFLLICDTVARSLMPPVEIPVGVVTALIGAPVFVWILLGARAKWAPSSW
ncbi:MAG: iron ABC transporter permease [Deltaproteobacteria bacterium]|nr:iron ABC transporter permease [Deltaproteobacteria bacterium]